MKWGINSGGNPGQQPEKKMDPHFRGDERACAGEDDYKGGSQN